MSLKDDGFRYLVSPDKVKADWIHPAYTDNTCYVGWTDCTDMSDAEFDAFVCGQPREEIGD